MSGFYAFLFAMQVCDEVDVYGFAPWRDPPKVRGKDKEREASPPPPPSHQQPYHYFDSAVPRPGSHSFDLALYIYKLFAIAYDNVRIFE